MRDEKSLRVALDDKEAECRYLRAKVNVLRAKLSEALKELKSGEDQ
jgi:hypothetical protein